MFNLNINNEILKVENSSIQLSIKREDQIHPFISGNKYRKVKYNLEKAKQLGHTTILTFGGAFSNHICAVASVGKLFGFNTIGVVRGEELEDAFYNNPTLSYAHSCGMRFKFVARDEYRQKSSKKFINSLKNEYGSFYLLPEGGTNKLAIKGCEEIITKADKSFDYICCAVGTGGTISGIINSSSQNQKVLGFPALKGEFLKREISTYSSKTNWKLIHNYNFGGYAKINEDLIEFINRFKDKYNIALDPVYTGKMLFGIFDMISKGLFDKSAKILAVHTGGLQGIEGMNMRLKNRNMPLLK